MRVRCCVVLSAMEPFSVQINSHQFVGYISGNTGKARDERPAKFCAANLSESVVELRKGSLLHVDGDKLHYISARPHGFKALRPSEETREKQGWHRGYPFASEGRPVCDKFAATTAKRAYNALLSGRYNDQHEIP